MSKNKLLKLITLIVAVGLLSTAIAIKPASGLISQNLTSWFWTGDTNVSAVLVGDVNGDGKAEIVTGGWYNDGTHWNAQLIVWDPATMAVLNVVTWFWGTDTQISSIAIGDVNGDGKVEIVTGGSYYDGARWVAQLAVWDGATLAFLKVATWYWTSDTQISVAVANITGTTGLSIVTGGSYFDNTRTVAQLAVWNGATLALQNVATWFWTSNTYINSVTAANLSGGTTLSIITGGAFFDGTRYNAQLVSWNAATLALQNIATWFWTGDTEINSVAAGNITGGASLSIVTGGSFFDGTRYNAQLATWNGATLASQNIATYYFTSNTRITALAVGNYSGGTSLDVVSGGLFNDGVRNSAQVIDFNGANLAVNSATNWFVTSDTQATSVAIGNFGLGNRIVAGGSNFDLIRANAELTIWV